MMKIVLSTALAVSAAVLPLAASADTSPLVNRVIVQQGLQQQMQNQLNVQSSQLQAEQDLSRANLQAQLQQQMLELQNLQLQQQINLIKLQQRARSSKFHKAPHHSH
jgi:hypothetical protein